jgi:hypothetical protein
LLVVGAAVAVHLVLVLLVQVVQVVLADMQNTGAWLHHFHTPLELRELRVVLVLTVVRAGLQRLEQQAR